MAITNVEIKKNNNENGTSTIRRFTRKMQETEIVKLVKSRRYATRKPSKLSLKDGALKKIAKRAVYQKMQKLGKVIPKK
ncbi:MAG: hypothetical protein WCO58_00210 [bacterium]|jgi:ribosomal protein S21